MTAQHPDGARYRAGPATTGPWAAHLQHGGPPNALAVACAERVLHEQTGRDDLTAVRLSADFVGPSERIAVEPFREPLGSESSSKGRPRRGQSTDQSQGK